MSLEVEMLTVGPVAENCFVFLFYIPLGYYTDSLLYKRRMRHEAKT